MAKWKRVTIAELAADVAGRVNFDANSESNPTSTELVTCSSSERTELRGVESCFPCTNLNEQHGLTVVVTFQN